MEQIFAPVEDEFEEKLQTTKSKIPNNIVSFLSIQIDRSGMYGISLLLNP